MQIYVPVCGISQVSWEVGDREAFGGSMSLLPSEQDLSLASELISVCGPQDWWWPLTPSLAVFTCSAGSELLITVAQGY